MGLKAVENFNDCSYVIRKFLGLVPSQHPPPANADLLPPCLNEQDAKLHVCNATKANIVLGGNDLCISLIK